MGRYLTDLADVLRAAGLDVVEVPGWQTRSWRGGTTPDGGLLSVSGGLVHHTGTSAGTPGDYPTLNTIVHGRVDVAGPLAQLGLGRSGTWYVIAAGRANHSGAVDDQRYFNSRAIGVEAEHPGGSTPWTDVQYNSYVKGCAALGAHYGFTWRGHKEAAVPHGRKVDPTFNMDQFRADVLTGGGVVPVTNPVPPAPVPAPTVVQNGSRGPVVSELQTLLNGVGYNLVVDGIFGNATEAALRDYQASRGLLVDGIAGPQTFSALRSGKPPVIAPLTVDGVWGELTTKALQRALGVAADGIFGPVTIAALQRRVGATPDGVYGPLTRKALQRHLGVTADGIVGPVTIKALQSRLNAGTF